MKSPSARSFLRTLVVLAAAFVTLASVMAVGQGGERPVVTAADYARAEKFLAANVNPLVVGGSVSPSWMTGDRFWYRSQTAEGTEFLVVDPARKTRQPAFDHARLAAALSAAAGATYSATELPFQSIELSEDGKSVSFDVESRRFTCDVQGTKCSETREAAGGRGAGAPARGGRGRGNTVTSPDGKKAVFIRDWNLWVRDLATGQERALTKDGEEDFGYATHNAGWTRSDRPIVLWSPDSRKIATYQQDERKVGEMYLVTTNVGHPELQRWKYPLPGDEVVAMMHRVVIDVETGEITRLKMKPDFHRSTLGDDFSVSDIKWSPDAKRLVFASTSRDHKHTVVREADVATGVVRDIFDETVLTHFESRSGWEVLWSSNEIIWYSQRDDWGHLYLYDLETGKLKHQITRGEGPVADITRVDEKTRTIFFVALGREKGRDPYFRHFYRIGIDGQNYALLTPDDGDHTVNLSPSGAYFVDTYSKPDVPPVSVLRDAKGNLVMPLEKADISKLEAIGWKPPVPITVKADDGKTDLYGLMFRPTNLDPSKKYPIVNNAYPGPQSGSTGSRSFAAARGDRQALAELGFIVVTIDGRGTPGRSKSFHDYYYGKMGRDNTIPDQVAGMKDLARQYPYIDLDRAGIWGHSGGGFIAAGAMFRYPDFFKVGISESGNHDQRNYEDDWGERYQGLLVRNEDGTDNYEAEANQTLAANLKGKLLLAHGLMDGNVPPYNTFLVVEALLNANKDFDLIVFPNQAHGFGPQSPYMMRRRWDYFVKWLMGAEPPQEYQMQQAR